MITAIPKQNENIPLGPNKQKKDKLKTYMHGSEQH